MNTRSTILLLGFLLLVSGNAAAIEVEHELPERTNVGVTHNDIDVRITDPEDQYDGVCRATLFLDNGTGGDPHELDVVDSTCRWGGRTADGTPYATFSFDLTIEKEQANAGNTNTIILDFELQWRDKAFVRTTEHDIIVNPILKATFDVTTNGLHVQTDANQTYTEDNTQIRFAWDWGDGSPVHFIPLAYQRHTYDHTGQYTIKLDVRDGYGQTDTARQVVRVAPQTEEEEGPGPGWALILLAPALLGVARRSRRA